MIPDEAVNAANEAVFRNFNGMIRPALVKVILEAAAPYMLAGAWDEGMEAMYATTSSEWPPIPELNPHRSQAHGDH